ncbi:MAG: hypothetical protein OXC26_11500 [Albidovulum sp.]|nr:hypothetical protein [Albidovulum sp.]
MLVSLGPKLSAGLEKACKFDAPGIDWSALSVLVAAAALSGRLKSD